MANKFLFLLICTTVFTFTALYMWKKKSFLDITNFKYRDISEEVHYSNISSQGRTYYLPDDIKFRLPWPNFESAKDRNNYIGIVSAIEAECRSRSRMGAVGDGGWDVCTAGPYQMKPGCLVYDFGINNQWSFDEAVVKEYGCYVKAFDPTMSSGKHTRGAKINFYPVGLSGKDGKIKIRKKTCVVKTFRTLVRELGDDKKVIDYLKIDIESSEWSSLSAMFKDNILEKYVKQIGIEVHEVHLTSTRNYVSILSGLSKRGFRKWHHNWNFHCIYRINKSFFTKCNELYYINTNFLLKEMN